MPRRSATSTPSVHRPPSMRERYDALVRDMKKRYGIRIKKWRRSSSGCAWEVHYHDGSVSRLIEAPYPRGPMSAAIFLHEVGHHAIGLQRYRPRCLEELKAWEWSIDTMRAYGLNVTPAVEKRVRDSLEYAVYKSMRRGIKSLPAELEPYRPPRPPIEARRNGRNGRAARNGAAPPAESQGAGDAELKTNGKQNGHKKNGKRRMRTLWLFPIHD